MEYTGKYRIILDQLPEFDKTNGQRDQIAVEDCDCEELEEIRALREIVEQLTEPEPVTFTLA